MCYILITYIYSNSHNNTYVYTTTPTHTCAHMCTHINDDDNHDSYHDDDGDEDDDDQDCCYDYSYDGGDDGCAATFTTMTTRMCGQVFVCARSRTCLWRPLRALCLWLSAWSVIANCCNPTQQHKIHKSILHLYRVAACMRQNRQLKLAVPCHVVSLVPLVF